jgi:antitoxin FitA
MAQVLIRNLDDGVVQRLKERAAAQGRSLEQELRTILTGAARLNEEEFLHRAAELRARQGDRPQTDSAILIREDRDR